MADIASRGLRVSAVDALSQLYREPPLAERNQQILRYQIELAGSRRPVRDHYFGFGGERDDRRAMKVYAERLAPCLELAEQLNVTILLENEFDSAALDPAGTDITRRPEVVRELIEQVGSDRFRTNFDPSNYNFAGAEPFPYAYEVLKDVIEYVHVKDGHRLTELGPAHDAELWVRSRDFDREYGWCPVGEGAVNWDGLLRALVRHGYDGFIALEPHCQPARRGRAAPVDRVRPPGSSDHSASGARGDQLDHVPVGVLAVAVHRAGQRAVDRAPAPAAVRLEPGDRRRRRRRTRARCERCRCASTRSSPRGARPRGFVNSNSCSRGPVPEPR